MKKLLLILILSDLAVSPAIARSPRETAAFPPQIIWKAYGTQTFYSDNLFAGLVENTQGNRAVAEEEFQEECSKVGGVKYGGFRNLTGENSGKVLGVCIPRGRRPAGTLFPIVEKYETMNKEGDILLEKAQRNNRLAQVKIQKDCQGKKGGEDLGSWQTLPGDRGEFLTALCHIQ